MSAATRFAVDPGVGTPIDEIPSIVQRLETEFETASSWPLAWRREQLERLRRMVRTCQDELLEALRADLGKPAAEAWVGDLAPVLMEIRGALRNLRRWTRPERVGGLPLLGRAQLIQEPLGVVLIISAWNYPVSLLLSPLVGALAAGNTVVLKPSEVAAHTSAVLARRVREYLDPAGVAVVEGGVEQTTALLEQHFDHIFYTGNGAVGRIVMEAAARELASVTLELGGKSPCIVDCDVDLEIAARRIAWGKFINAGQTCVAPDYVLVHERCEDELIVALGVAIESFYGEDPSASPDYARIVNRRHWERLCALLADGDVVIGGEVDASRCYIAPTVLRNVSADSAIMKEEIFGPILPLLRVKSMEDAVDFVNERDRPLALYLFSEDEEVREEVLEETSSGGVCVNGTLLQSAHPSLPFGGIGESGTGAYHGRHTFEAFSHRKPVLTRGLRFDPSFLYPPYGERTVRWLRRLL
jgi:aldehyde dehydrogenase (NAD+)